VSPGFVLYKSFGHLRSPKMYFWNIERLKHDMALRPLSEGEVLPYVTISGAAIAALGYIPSPGFNVWDGLGATWSTTLAVLGTIFIYRENGGANGSHFLQRYVAIGFVVSLRWIVATCLVVAGLIAALFLADVEIQEDTTWYAFAFLGIAETILYLRIAHHVRDLRQRVTGREDR
jgi:type III secretory pathway component EscS